MPTPAGENPEIPGDESGRAHDRQLNALAAQVEAVREDEEFVARVRDMTESDREIMDRLAR